jgi:hypothetical protein
LFIGFVAVLSCKQMADMEAVEVRVAFADTSGNTQGAWTLYVLRIHMLFYTMQEIL